MSDSNEINEIRRKAAEEFIDKLSVKAKLDDYLREVGDVGNMPLVIGANVAIFGVMVSIFLSSKNEAEVAIKIVTLVSLIISAFIIPLNFWFIRRLKLRLDDLKTEYNKIFEETKALVLKTLEFNSSIVKNTMKAQADTLIKNVAADEDILQKFIEAEKEADYDYIAKKSGFVFEAYNQLALFKFYYYYKKHLELPRDENFATTKLILDQVSNKLKYSGLSINIVLTILALLITTFTS